MLFDVHLHSESSDGYRAYIRMEKKLIWRARNNSGYITGSISGK